MLLLKCILIVGFCAVHSVQQNATTTFAPTTTREAILTESPAIIAEVSIPNAPSIETSFQIPIPPTAVQEALPAANIQNALPDSIQSVVPPADKQGALPPPASIQEILQLPPTQEAEPVPIAIVQVEVPAPAHPGKEATPPPADTFQEANPTEMVEKAVILPKEISDPAILNDTLDHAIQNETPVLEIKKEIPDVDIQKQMPENNTQNGMLPPAIQKEIPDPAIQNKILDLASQKELPALVIQTETQDPTIRKEILDLAAQQELPVVVIQKQTPAPAIQIETPAPTIQKQTPAPAIQNPTPAPTIQNEIPDLKEIPSNATQLNLLEANKGAKRSNSIDLVSPFSNQHGRAAGGDDETAAGGAPPSDTEENDPPKKAGGKEPAKKGGAVKAKKKIVTREGGGRGAKKGGGGAAKKGTPAKKTGEKKPAKPKETDVKSESQYDTTVPPPTLDEPKGRAAAGVPHMGRAVPEGGTTKAPAKKNNAPAAKKAVAAKKPTAKPSAKKGGGDAAKKKPPAKKGGNDAAKKKPPAKKGGDKPAAKKEGVKKKKKELSMKARIVGGKVTKPNEYPYQVAILFDGKIGCGGSILNQHWILTASHCFEGVEPASVTIIAGEHNLRKQEGKEQTIQVETIHDHEEYDPELIKNDITLLKLSKPLRMNQQVQAIKLADKDYKVDAGTDVTVTGWGHTKEDGKFSDLLRMVTVPAVDHEKCKEIYEANAFHDGQLCAGRFGKGGKDACQGDSGGPLVVPNKAKKGTWLQVGVVSYGMGCAAKDFPGAYTEVAFFRDWIDTTMSS